MIKRVTSILAILLGFGSFVVGAIGVQGHHRHLEGIAFLLFISTIVVYAVGMLAKGEPDKGNEP